MNIFYLLTLIFLTSIVKFTVNYKYFLTTLICIEFMVLLLFFWQSQILNSFDFEKSFLMLFITFSVCEGVLGISLMIFMIRVFNNSFLSSLNCFMC